ncbi:hypothetical protein P280DRAFT_36253 [Massarina eburnea CBS 473.64]|uniref:Uncharacterized protein n=1 Tax=Massarina eburnea CBS 473.64 TaxID=1395130 RepID=A0A6A6RYY7_9PLEO|nr:hypothetical protein P280DRAFT_36253 [Massarina eburnea CBS 473.64]
METGFLFNHENFLSEEKDTVYPVILSSRTNDIPSLFAGRIPAPRMPHSETHVSNVKRPRPVTWKFCIAHNTAHVPPPRPRVPPPQYHNRRSELSRSPKPGLPRLRLIIKLARRPRDPHTRCHFHSRTWASLSVRLFGTRHAYGSEPIPWPWLHAHVRGRDNLGCLVMQDIRGNGRRRI